MLVLATVAFGQEKSLFNGKDLTGWDAKPGWWTVEDGALTSESTAEKPCKKCNYLIWKGGEPGDFELTLDFKLTGQGNSGIQIRSERRPDFDTYGYQADMDWDGKLVGYVYHHKRGLIAARGQKVVIPPRGEKKVETIGDAAKLKEVYKKGDWNQYKILCRGPNISLHVNGTLMCQVTDNDAKTAKPDGIIALQMHPGPPMKVQFKNIMLKPLGPVKKTQESVKKTGNETQLTLAGANWIWNPVGRPQVSAPVGPLALRRTFKIKDPTQLASARLILTADDAYVFNVNGEKLISHDYWPEVKQAEIPLKLLGKDNVLAVAAQNAGAKPSPAGVIAKLLLKFKDGKSQTIVTDGQWKTAPKGGPNWKTTAGDDSKWESAKVLGAYGVAPWGTPAPGGEAVKATKVGALDEAQLIAVLQSGAGQKEKTDACRELGRIGTAACVPALAALLTDEKLSHMARYGLEPILCPEADEALRNALGQLKGLHLAGLVSTLGLRGDEKSVPAIIGLLKDSDPNVALQAARALGRIGGAGPAKALQATLSGTKGTQRAAVCDALFECAEASMAAGHDEQATAIYDALRGLPDAAPEVEAGALRGAILSRGKDGLPLLAESIRGADIQTAETAAKAALESKEADVAIVLAGEIEKLQADRQILVAEVLGKRRDVKALPALLALTKAEDTSVRVAALRAAAEIGGTGPIAPLIALMKDPDAQVAKAATDALAGLRGHAVDQAVIQTLKTSDPAFQVKMVDQIARRRILSAVPVLAERMADENDAVRVAVIQTFGRLAGPKHLPQLLERIVGCTNPRDIAALGKAITSICAAADDPKACAPVLTPALTKAGNAVKPELLKALKLAGGPEALKAVRGAVDDPDKGVHTAAIRTLSEWPTPDVAPVLLALAKNSTEELDKVLSLRGYLDIAMRKEVPPPTKLGICRNAAPLIRRDDEKRMLLGALSALRNPASFPLVTPYLDDAAVKRDAVATVMTIMKQAGKRAHTPAGKAALQKVIQVSGANSPSAKEAKGLLKKIE
jgi:HEAT repeat protein